VIAHIHSLTMATTKFGLFKEQMLNERGRTIVFCSKAAEESYRRIFPLAQGQGRVVYNGVACEHFASCDRIALRPVVFGCLASLYAHKGHAVLIEAVRLLKEKKIEVSVVCAGTGPLASLLSAKANAAGVFESIRFLGQIEDTPKFFKAIDVLVLPSTEREGMPMSVLEAMAAGKSVIASDVGGVREAVQNGVTGILVSPNDPAALAEAMRRMVLDTMGASTMGATAQRIARADFSRLTMLEKIEALYA
jgi:glycosyltransferase involved in cell wall biosynthesis